MNIVTELKVLLQKHKADNWKKLLLDSITEAKQKAKLEGLRGADKFPVGLEGKNGYYAYLEKLVKWIPRENYDEEVLYHLCEFYWLLNQPPGKKLQKSKSFNKWMRDFANQWGSFLNTDESAKDLQTFVDDPAFRAGDYMPNPSGWRTFNQFFAREIKPGLRPVAGMFDDNIVCSSADSTFVRKFPIGEDNEVVIKLTHKYKILDLLEGSPYQERFKGGMFYHAFLGPNDYHRFRAPVRGTVLECRAIQQNVYLQVKIQDGKFSAPDGAGYEFTQTRGLIVFDSPIGLVAVLPIGMAQVSSVNMTAVVGSYLNKGEEFGYFMFGGSDIIMLFEEQSNVVISAAPGVHYNCGMAIGETVSE